MGKIKEAYTTIYPIMHCFYGIEVNMLDQRLFDRIRSAFDLYLDIKVFSIWLHFPKNCRNEFWCFAPLENVNAL